MAEMEPGLRQEFALFQKTGFSLNASGDFGPAYDAFRKAHDIALELGDEQAQVDVLNPMAKSLWSMHDFVTAHEVLTQAEEIGERNGWRDEVGIAHSNMGRAAAVRCLSGGHNGNVVTALQDYSVGYFEQALAELRGHEHYHHRFANARHGSVVAALAGQRGLAGALITEGLRVALPAGETYDPGKRQIREQSSGMAQLALAAALIPLGNHTPVLAGIGQGLVRR